MFAIRFLRPAERWTKCLDMKTSVMRPYSSIPTTEKSGVLVATSHDGNMIACWHPEQPIPYEHTLPIPESEFQLAKDASVLKPVTMKHLQRPKADLQMIDELAVITYTTKHRWFPRSRERKWRKALQDRKIL